MTSALQPVPISPVEEIVADMKAGRIVDRGTPAELIARYGRNDMEQVFLDIARGTRVGEEA